MQMNLTELRNLVNNIDTFGINPDHVQVNLVLNDREVQISSSPRVSINVGKQVQSRLIIDLAPRAVGE